MECAEAGVREMGGETVRYESVWNGARRWVGLWVTGGAVRYEDVWSAARRVERGV